MKHLATLLAVIGALVLGFKNLRVYWGVMLLYFAIWLLIAAHSNNRKERNT